VIALFDGEHTERLALVEVLRNTQWALRRFHAGEAVRARVRPAIDEGAVVEDLIGDRPVRADASQTEGAGSADAVVLTDSEVATRVVLLARFPLRHRSEAFVAANQFLPNLALFP
jgi:hypothetical protein